MKHRILATSGLLAMLSVDAYSAEVVIDNDDGPPAYTETGVWRNSASNGYNGGTYRFITSTAVSPGTATWVAALPEAGRYEVYTSFLRSANRTSAAPFTVVHAGGSDVVTIDQRGSGIGEVALGTYNFDTSATVTLTSGTVPSAYIADAIIFRTAVDRPPVVGATRIQPLFPQESDTVVVTATATDDIGLQSTYFIFNSNFGELPSPAYDDGAHNDGVAGDGVFGGTAPHVPTGFDVTVFLRAKDTAGNQTDGPMARWTVGAVAKPEYRAIWADSWNESFLNEAEAQDLVSTCRAANINTIIVEVRKIGDAYYNSSLEPRATNISGGPAYDPLARLIEIAHDTSGGQKRIQVHGWFVMHRISKGETLSPQHVLSQHPEYIMSNALGATNGDGSIFLDPGHPGTVDHNDAVIMDCLEHYDIDGVNLDYIRYPEAAGEWGYNPVSVQRFNDFTGKSGQPVPTDPDWDAWRRGNVTGEVRKIFVDIARRKPNVVLSTCTINWGSNYTEALYPTSQPFSVVFQNWTGWLDEGIIDYNAIMNYATDNTRYQGWTDLSLAHDDSRGSIIGIGAYLQPTVQASIDQLAYARNAGAAGLNIYDWGSEVAATSGATREQFYTELKAQVFPDWAEPPVPAWRNSPDAKSIFEGTVTHNGSAVDHALVTIDEIPGKSVYTDGSGWYGLLDVPAGTYTLRFAKPNLSTAIVASDIDAGFKVRTVDAQLADVSTPTPTQTPAPSATPTRTPVPSSPSDTDRDGLRDSQEDTLGTDRTKIDTDGDTFEDGVEVALGYDPLNPNSPANRTDADSDGIPDASDNNPASGDSDGDGIRDGYEVAQGSDPANHDSRPNLGDADGDGHADFTDAVIIFNVFLGNLNGTSFADAQYLDVNRDGLVDSVDGVILFNWYLGNIPYIPLN